MLGWSQGQLANASGMAKNSIADFETGKRAPLRRTMTDIVSALNAVSVIFVRERRRPWREAEEKQAVTEKEYQPKELQVAIEQVAGLLEIRFRPMFGGMTGYAEERPFASLSNRGPSQTG